MQDSHDFILPFKTPPPVVALVCRSFSLSRILGVECEPGGLSLRGELTEQMSAPASANGSKDDTAGIMSRTSGLAGWRKEIRQVASLEDTALVEIDEHYDNIVPKGEQEEWHHEKLRLLKDESEAIMDAVHAVTCIQRVTALSVWSGFKIALGSARPLSGKENRSCGTPEESTN